METLTVEECEKAVQRPGKFEGESRYVPYFWTAYDGDYEQYKYGYYIACYKVRPEDKVLFPELKRRKVIKLIETNDGFVEEVQC
jgi:hypothetical protein